MKPATLLLAWKQEGEKQISIGQLNIQTKKKYDTLRQSTNVSGHYIQGVKIYLAELTHILFIKCLSIYSFIVDEKHAPSPITNELKFRG